LFFRRPAVLGSQGFFLTEDLNCMDEQCIYIQQLTEQEKNMKVSTGFAQRMVGACAAQESAGGETMALMRVPEAPLRFRAASAAELQDLDIWRIVACLPYSSFAEIKSRILSLSRDHSFAMNYWVKVCKVRATKGLPMPWDQVH
jgi:hypothetical protein